MSQAIERKRKEKHEFYSNMNIYILFLLNSCELVASHFIYKIQNNEDKKIRQNNIAIILNDDCKLL